jgi:hypothetical protein
VTVENQSHHSWRVSATSSNSVCSEREAGIAAKGDGFDGGSLRASWLNFITAPVRNF